ELVHRLAEAGADDVTVLDTLERLDREPFGFRDGISQPVMEGLPRAAGGGRRVRPGIPERLRAADRPAAAAAVRRSQAAAAARPGRIRRGRPGTERDVPGAAPARAGRRGL